MAQHAEDAMVAFLTGDTDVAALMGMRIYPMVAPQKNSFPHATYQRITTANTPSNNGASSLAKAEIQLDLWGLTYPSVKDLALAVRAATGDPSVVVPFDGRYGAFDGFKGRVGDTTIQGMWITNEAHGHEPPIHATETGVFRVTLAVACWYER